MLHYGDCFVLIRALVARGRPKFRVLRSYQTFVEMKMKWLAHPKKLNHKISLMMSE
jgi:hypothetical protein